MAKKFMLGIECNSESGLTQGVGFNITFESQDSGFRSANFKDWRRQITNIVLRHRDDSFDPAKGEENARQLVSEIIAASQAKGIIVANEGDVPALQISGIDAGNKKQGKKLDISFSSADEAASTITSNNYTTRSAQEINGDGTAGIRLPEKKNFEFIGRVIAL